MQSLGGHPTADAVLAAIAATLAWGPLMRKRISKQTAESLPWWLRLFGTMIGASVDAGKHTADAFCGISAADIISKRSLTEVACVALIGQEPKPADLFAFQTLVGLLLTNGPGAISAQGAKGATSADGPEAPGRVQFNKALVGFLTHSGYAHGGNGYEGVAFLLERFKGVELADPDNPKHGLDLKAMATEFARRYGEERTQRKEVGAESAAGAAVHQPPGVQGQAGQRRSARRVRPQPLRGARRVQRVPRLLPHAGAGALRRERDAQRVLRQRRCRDRRTAAEDAVAALPGGQLLASGHWKRPRSRCSCTAACSDARRRSTIT